MLFEPLAFTVAAKRQKLTAALHISAKNGRINVN
jgi:hypothetical protein